MDVQNLPDKPTKGTALTVKTAMDAGAERVRVAHDALIDALMSIIAGSSGALQIGASGGTANTVQGILDELRTASNLIESNNGVEWGQLQSSVSELFGSALVGVDGDNMVGMIGVTTLRDALIKLVSNLGNKADISDIGIINDAIGVINNAIYAANTLIYSLQENMGMNANAINSLELIVAGKASQASVGVNSAAISALGTAKVDKVSGSFLMNTGERVKLSALEVDTHSQAIARTYADFDGVEQGSIAEAFTSRVDKETDRDLVPTSADNINALYNRSASIFKHNDFCYVELIGWYRLDGTILFTSSNYVSDNLLDLATGKNTIVPCIALDGVDGCWIYQGNLIDKAEQSAVVVNSEAIATKKDKNDLLYSANIAIPVTPKTLVLNSTNGVATISASTHGLTTSQIVRFTGTIPTPLVINTDYWVIVLDANNFQLSAEPNLVAITMTTSMTTANNVLSTVDNPGAITINGLNIDSTINEFTIIIQGEFYKATAYANYIQALFRVNGITGTSYNGFANAAQWAYNSLPLSIFVSANHAAAKGIISVKFVRLGVGKWRVESNSALQRFATATIATANGTPTAQGVDNFIGYLTDASFDTITSLNFAIIGIILRNVTIAVRAI